MGQILLTLINIILLWTVLYKLQLSEIVPTGGTEDVVAASHDGNGIAAPEDTNDDEEEEEDADEDSEDDDDVQVTIGDIKPGYE